MNTKSILSAIGLVLVVVIDRVIRRWFLINPAEMFGGDFVSGLLTFHLVFNQGIAFGIDMQHYVLITMSAVIIIALIVAVLLFWRRHRSLLSILSLSMIIIGAASNLYDRVYFGAVIDYIDLKWFTVFNLSDVLITSGVVLYLLLYILEKPLDKNPKKI